MRVSRSWLEKLDMPMVLKRLQGYQGHADVTEERLSIFHHSEEQHHMEIRTSAPKASAPKAWCHHESSCDLMRLSSSPILLGCLVVILFTVQQASAEESSYFSPGQYTFHRIGHGEGIPSHNVSSVVQDTLGFIWIGTYAGLARYDGRTSEVFQLDDMLRPEESQRGAATTITTLASDAEGRVWIGTEKHGVIAYSVRNDRFEAVDDLNRNLSSKLITDLYVDSRGALWVTTEDGHLVRYFKGRAEPSQISWETTHSVLTVEEGEPGQLLVGTVEGDLVVFNIARGKFNEIRLHDAITTIEYEGRDVAWVGTYSSGLTRINIASGERSHFMHDENDVHSLMSNEVAAILMTKDRELWVATRTGVSRLENRSKGSFDRYETDPNVDFSLPAYLSTDLLEDREGYVWITMAGGLARHDDVRAQFHWQPTRAASFCEESEGVWWVGSWSGMMRYDLRNRTADLLPVENVAKGLRHNAQITTCLYQSGVLWASIWSVGLVRYDMRTNEAELLRSYEDGSPGPLEQAYTIFPSEGDQLMLATLGSGVVLFDPTRHAIRELPVSKGPLLSDNIIALLQSPFDENVLWLGSFDSGIYKYNLSTRETRQYKHLDADGTTISHNYVTAIQQTQPDELWVTTDGGGLNRMVISSGTFERVAPAAGTILNGLLAGSDGALWFCSTGRGVVRYDPATERITSFSLRDGALDECVDSGLLSTKAGYLHYAGVNGFIRFDPRKVEADVNAPRTLIKNLMVQNRPLELQQPPWRTPAVNLTYRDAFFEVQAASLSFGDPQQNILEYRLLGLSSSWKKTKSGEVSFSQLPSGDYTLEVRSINRHGVRDESPASLRVYVSPPPWLSWWAYTAYAFLFLGCLLLFVRRQNQKVKAVHKDARLAAAEKELALTAAVQQGFLPDQAFYDDGDYRLAGFYKSAEVCSGDWWLYDLQDDALRAVVVGDVTGHGAGPAMVTAAAATSFRLSQGQEMKERFRDLHTAVSKIGSQGYAMVASALEIQRGGEVHIWSAGGVPALVWEEGPRAKAVVATSGAVGSTEFASVRKITNLRPGGRAMLLTDGIIEVSNAAGRPLGLRRIAKMMGETATLPLEEAVSALADVVAQHSGQADQDDDWTFVLLERVAQQDVGTSQDRQRA